MKGNSSRYLARLSAGLLAIVLAGCGGGGGDPPNIGFTVTPPTIALGASSTLSWTSSGAATCQASGAWSGPRPVNGSEAVSPTAPGSYTYTLSCANVVGGSSVSGTLTVTPPVEQSLTIEGQVVDRPIANAAVTVRVGSRSFTGTAGADGRYSIVATVPSNAVADFVSIDAIGSAADPTVRFRSLLGTFSALQAQAGADRRLVAGENFNVNLSGHSTAESVLIAEQTPGETALTASTLAAARRALDPDELLETATLIRLVRDGTASLPDGVNDTLDLVDDPATRRAFFLEQTQTFDANELFVATRAAVDLDTAQTPGVSSAEVPSVLYLTLLGTRTPEYRYVVVSGRSEGYEFNADGTGVYLSTTGNNNNLRWTVESNRDLRIRFDPPVIFEPFEAFFDDPITGQEVRTTCVNEFVGVRIRRGLGDSAVRTSTNTRTCADSRFNETQSDRAGRHWLPASATAPYLAAEVAGSRFVLTVDGSDVPGTIAGESGGLLHEIASFGSGGIGSLEPTGRAFQWQVTNDGTLQVTLANGVESRYRRTYQPFPNAVIGLADHRYPGGRRVISDQIGYIADNSLIFSPTTLIGTHYLAGVGTDRPSPTGGGAVLLSPLLKGSAFEFAGDGTARIRTDTLRFDPSTGIATNERMFTSGARRTYRIGADGTVVVRFHLRFEAPGSACGFDEAYNEISFTGCALIEERRLIPLAVSSTGRNFWLEQTRNAPVANGVSVVASGPYITSARYFDFAPFGDYALPANPP